MKKYLCTTILLMLAASVYSWDFGFSFSYKPFNFHTYKDYSGYSNGEEHYYLYDDYFYYDTFYKHDYDVIYDKFGQLMIYQGGLKHRSGLNFGFGLTYDSGYDIDDNLVGSFADILGYAGFKFISVRVTTSSLTGKIIFHDADMIANGHSTRNFTDRRTFVDLLCYFTGGLSFGIYYHNYTFNGDLRLGLNNDYTFADPYTETTLISYGVVMLGDTFSLLLYDNLLHFGTEDYKGGFAGTMWLEGTARIGFGPRGTKRNVITNEEEKTEYIAVSLLCDYIFGLMFAVGSKNSDRLFVGGIGYHLFTTTLHLQHGVIFRAAVKF